jgi:hypothetical protein
MNQDRMREQDAPNRQSNMDQAEGPRDNSTGVSEQGRGSNTERNRADGGSPRSSSSGGITNRPLDRERCEQEQIPERGQSQSER